MGASENLRTRLFSSQRSFNKYIFYDQNFFLQNEYIFKKDLYFICNTNIFCIKIYFPNEIFIFTFSFFSVKKKLQYKSFFPYKNNFFCKCCIFCKKQIFSQKKKMFFQLSLATNEQPYLWSWRKNGLIRKIRLTSKIMTSQLGLQTIAIYILPNVSQSKDN